MKIRNIVCSKSKTGFFFDDQKAIKKNAVPDGAVYIGEPVTEGFKSVRQAGEAITVIIQLEDGQLAYGDCTAVQYSGVGGRDPLFLTEHYLPEIQKHIVPLLQGRELRSFRKLAEEVDGFINPETGKRLHTAIRYGVTQAILDAVAKSRRTIMAEVIAQEYGTIITDKEIPIFTQSGDNRYDNADKMILKMVDVLPHALINNMQKLGTHGEVLLKYIKWLRQRIKTIKPEGTYEPVLHIDVYGTIGHAFENDPTPMIQYFKQLQEAARPFKLRIEGPVDMDDRESQMQMLRTLTERIDKENMQIEIVADEWCNTLDDIRYFADHRAGHMIQIKTPDLGGINNSIEAVLYCKGKGIAAYVGGSCNETHTSAQVSVHVATATRAEQILAKPGMGVDEGFMIVYNEMQKILIYRKDLIVAKAQC